MEHEFIDQVALITGAGSGIGKATAALLAAKGAVVVINDISADHAEATAQEIGERGGRAHVIVGDVTEPGFVDSMFDRVADDHGRLDIAHNNVGFGGNRSIIDTEDSAWQHGLDGNLGATFRGVRAALRIMVPKRRGVIINTASAAGVRKVAGVAPYYGTAKAGVIHLTREAAVEAGEFGIRVNAIVPGAVHTPAFEAYLGADRFRQYMAQLPLRRMAEAEDVAEAVAFLASPRAAAITGIALPIDSGVGAVMYQPTMN
ncbi:MULTISPECIES: SDR family NAD(P)-dependent oxidoreductase [unclassified Rhodococcus (in: high G+C Gram-positive bacteria)]|uniref:SDR family NAD(P)-dependent oxidoreductase n=1 Tax=unclassified Rhodococcus (in: high G+C Gram-positive bacteria) TaxID=192944 RepID=UPI000927A159|nr:SDR family NAD(P)-dependent oxidoreductase [Rhodococcus sp. M8]OLL20302.1 3-oxoacyl-ACP reductase [Rhodococcus sp. M8]